MRGNSIKGKGITGINSRNRSREDYRIPKNGIPLDFKFQTNLSFPSWVAVFKFEDRLQLARRLLGVVLQKYKFSISSSFYHEASGSGRVVTEVDLPGEGGRHIHEHLDPIRVTFYRRTTWNTSNLYGNYYLIFFFYTISIDTKTGTFQILLT